MCSLGIKTNLNKNKNMITPLRELYTPPAFFEPALAHVSSITERSSLSR